MVGISALEAFREIDTFEMKTDDKCRRKDVERSVYTVDFGDTAYWVTATSPTDALGVAMMTHVGQWPVTQEPTDGFKAEKLVIDEWTVKSMSEKVARKTMYEEEKRGLESMWDAHSMAEMSCAIACTDWD